ncbi:outer membrane protein [uncultured Hoeflea sp.]|uniref:outer membrane protein n=1 Tax=uncultured Hoeflea sp. TaxID=538666 RepID=UPI00262D577E|nr:outer membrane protein [uncultured Hoeflea sp.]
MLTRIAAMSCLAVLGLPAAASAADLDEIIYARELPVTKPVEVGSGWYLRGDLGYSARTRGEATSFSSFTAAPVPTYTVTTYDSSSIENDWSGSVGVGYSFTDYLRADLTFDYTRGNFGSSRASAAACAGVASGTCATIESQEFEQYGLMANAYVDLGTFAGFTPYVGGGAGMTRVVWDTLSRDNRCVSALGNACGAGTPTDTTHLGEESWRFTYALMAGVSYDLSRNLKLDVGYRYSKIDSGEQYGYDAASIAAGATGVQGFDDGFENHEVRAGLRYALW